jgi:hypothetical protein
MLGCCRCPTLLVLCRGSIPIMTCCGLMDRKASITTLPLTDCIGSITTATALGLSCSKDCNAAVIWERQFQTLEKRIREWLTC